MYIHFHKLSIYHCIGIYEILFDILIFKLITNLMQTVEQQGQMSFKHLSQALLQFRSMSKYIINLLVLTLLVDIFEFMPIAIVLFNILPPGPMSIAILPLNTLCQYVCWVYGYIYLVN